MPTPTITFTVSASFAAEPVSGTLVVPAPVTVRPVVSGATDEFGNAISDPLSAFEFDWDFGDTTQNAFEVVDPTTNARVKTNSSQRGIVASHVYVNRGDFTIKCTPWYWDKVAQAWIQLAQQTVAVEARDWSESANWESVYVNVNATGNNVGTVQEPLTSLASLRAYMSRHSRLAVYVAKGTTLLPSSDEPVLTIADVVGVRFLTYDAGITGAAPRLRLAAGSANKAVVSFAPSTGANAQNDVQELTRGGTPTSGTFDVTVGTETAVGIAYDADAATVEAALEALSNVGSGNVAVTGTWPTLTVTFQGALANTNMPRMTVSSVNLTPGTSVYVKRTQSGSPNVDAISNIVFYGFELDGNAATGSVGFKIDSATTYASHIAFINSRVSNTKSHAVQCVAYVNGGNSTSNLVLAGFQVDHGGAGVSGHAMVLRGTSNLVLLGGIVRGQVDSTDFINIDQFSTSQVQTDVLLAFFGTSSPGIRRRVVSIGGVTRALVYRANITAAATGIHLDKPTPADAVTHPHTIYIDSCEIHDIGDDTGGRGVFAKFVTNLIIQNNAFWNNGKNTAAVAGADIEIDDCLGAEEGASDARPIYIIHNSFFRAFARAGTPHIKINDYRHIRHDNNAYHYEGISLSSGAATRSIIMATESAYIQPSRNEVQKLAWTGTPSSGAFRLEFDSVQTGNIAFDAPASQVQTALEALSSIGAGNVSVTKAGIDWIVEFKGTLGFANQSSISVYANTTSQTLSVTTITNGSVGRFFSGKNAYFAPSLVRNNKVRPFAVNSAFLRLDVDTGDPAEATWRNGNVSGGLVVHDAASFYANPSFRNPASGDFAFGYSDPLIDGASHAFRTPRADIRGVTRAVADIGAYEFSGSTVAPTYSYAPAPLLSLPSADGRLYFDGSVDYIEAFEPLLVTGGSAEEVDNRPHYNLAARDNVITSVVSAMQDDLNRAFCSPPQPGSSLVAPHTSIASFISVSFNPDGTIKPEGLDFSTLPYLRTDGLNFMRADLRLGDVGSGEPLHKIVSMLPGDGPNEGATVDQVLLLNGDNLMVGTLRFAPGSAWAVDAANRSFANAGPSVGDTSLPQRQEVVRRTGDTMSGTLVVTAGGITVSGGNVAVSAGTLTVSAGLTVTSVLATATQYAATFANNRIGLVGSGVAATDGVNVGQTVLRSGANAMTGPLNMGGQQIVSLAAGNATGHAANCGQVMLLSGANAMSGPLNFGSQTGINIADAVTPQGVPSNRQVIHAYEVDTKWGYLQMGPHGWVNATTGAAEAFNISTSVQSGNDAITGLAAATTLGKKGHAIDLGAVSLTYALPASPSAPYFDGRFIRDPGAGNSIIGPGPGPYNEAYSPPAYLGNVSDGTFAADIVANGNRGVLADCGNAVFNVPWPMRGHDAANKLYVDTRFSTMFFAPEVAYVNTTEEGGVNLNSLTGSYNDTSFTGGTTHTVTTTQSLGVGTWLLFVSVGLDDTGGSGAQQICVARVKRGAAVSPVQTFLFGNDAIGGILLMFSLTVTTPGTVAVEFRKQNAFLQRVAVAAIRMS